MKNQRAYRERKIVSKVARHLTKLRNLDLIVSVFNRTQYNAKNEYCRYSRKGSRLLLLTKM